MQKVKKISELGNVVPRNYFESEFSQNIFEV